MELIRALLVLIVLFIVLFIVLLIVLFIVLSVVLIVLRSSDGTALFECTTAAGAGVYFFNRRCVHGVGTYITRWKGVAQHGLLFFSAYGWCSAAPRQCWARAGETVFCKDLPALKKEFKGTRTLWVLVRGALRVHSSFCFFRHEEYGGCGRATSRRRTVKRRRRASMRFGSRFERAVMLSNSYCVAVFVRP